MFTFGNLSYRHPSGVYGAGDKGAKVGHTVSARTMPHLRQFLFCTSYLFSVWSVVRCYGCGTTNTPHIWHQFSSVWQNKPNPTLIWILEISLACYIFLGEFVLSELAKRGGFGWKVASNSVHWWGHNLVIYELPSEHVDLLQKIWAIPEEFLAITSRNSATNSGSAVSTTTL